jgi:hypothetical protein
VRSDGFGVEDCGFGRHVAVHNAEFFAVGRPGDVVDGAFFVYASVLVYA